MPSTTKAECSWRSQPRGSTNRAAPPFRGSRAVRYSGSIMSDPGALDPIRLTRELVEIESTTYHEGAVGDFLAGFLEQRGWEVDKTPVPQPCESCTAGDRWNVYAETKGQRPDLV